MDNQHKLITGYRDLSPDEIELMNQVKKAGDNLGAVLDSMALKSEIDKRWLAIGRTQLQQGIMAVIRSIAQPTTF